MLFLIIESIPLNFVSTKPDAFVTEVQIEVDGKFKLFLLDTGAAGSTVLNDEQTSAYQSLNQVESKGASGIAASADVIQLQKIRLGNYTFRKSQIKRTDRSILGLDLIGERVFEVDFQHRVLNILSEFPYRESQLAVRKLATGHFTVPLIIEKTKTDALFDTGADTTVIDSEYIKQNSQLFELVRSEDGYDAHGNKIPSEVYKVRQLESDILKLQDVEMAAFSFGSHMREKMEGCPIILGNNVISKAKWFFDLSSGHWGLRPY